MFSVSYGARSGGYLGHFSVKMTQENTDSTLKKKPVVVNAQRANFILSVLELAMRVTLTTC